MDALLGMVIAFCVAERRTLPSALTRSTRTSAELLRTTLTCFSAVPSGYATPSGPKVVTRVVPVES